MPIDFLINLKMKHKKIKNEAGEYNSLFNQFDQITRQENFNGNKLHIIRSDTNSFDYVKVGEESFNPFYEPIYYMVDDSNSSEINYSS
jgi:hypothetical protein